MMRVRTFVVGLFGLVLLGCGGSQPADSAAPSGGPRWSGDDAYTMTYTSTCGENGWITDGPVTVSVDRGAAEVIDGPTPRELATVDRMFDLIALAEDGGATSIEADYGVHGEPRTVFIVHSSGLDDQLCFDVSSFVATPRRVGCRVGPYFPATALEVEPPLIADSPVPEVVDAIATFLEGEKGASWPQDGWRVLDVVSDEFVQLVHAGSVDLPSVSFMGVVMTPSGWEWDGASVPNDCDLVRDLSNVEDNLVEWRIDPASTQPGSDARSLTVLATEQACANGEDMGDRLNQPVFTVTDDAVLMLLTAKPVGGDAVTCPGNPSQRVEIGLPEPLGQRQLRDARATDMGSLGDVLTELIDQATAESEG